MAETLWEAGERLCEDLEGTREPLAVVWALTREAAMVSQHGAGVGPRGYPNRSALPEPLLSHWQRFAVLRDQTADGVTAPQRRSPCFSVGPASIDRAEQVSRLWGLHAFPKLAARRRMLMVIWLVAGGLTYAGVSRQTGVARPTIYRWRDIGCEDVHRAMMVRA